MEPAQPTNLRLERAAGSEGGFALPTVLFLMLALIGIVSVAAVAAIDTQNETVRDQDSKGALAVADSGTQVAMLRYSKTPRTEVTPCVGFDAMGQLVAQAKPAGSDWCTPVTGEVNGVPYTYWVKPDIAGSTIQIVAESADGAESAVSGEATRRVLVEAKQEITNSSGSNYLGPERVASHDWLAISGNTRSFGGAGTNGRLIIDGSAKICGQARYGPNAGDSPFGGATWQQPPERPRTNSNGTGGICDAASNPPKYPLPGSGIVDYPPVVLPPGLTPQTSATSRFFTQDGANEIDSWAYQNGSVRWNRADEPRTLWVGANQTLRLKSTQPYLVCRLKITEGGKLRAEANGQVRIFIDDPANCPNLPNRTGGRAYPAPQGWPAGTKEQLVIEGETGFTHNGYMPGVFMLGSDTIPTAALLQNGSVTHHNQMVLYAPRTHIDITGAFRFQGAVIGKTVNLANGAAIDAEFDGSQFQLPVATTQTKSAFQPTRFVECRSSGFTSTPSEGC